MRSTFHLPRVVVAGLAGNAGKTLVSIALARALRRLHLGVAVFKKGPDFIDTAWLSAAAGQTAHNLDTFLAPNAALLGSLERASGADIAVIEGNRGLFDGMDAQGTHSTAELAKRLDAPVLLVVDASKATRTVAALVLGCRAFDPQVRIAGVILNRVGTARQERLIRDALAITIDIPVVGSIPRLLLDHLPSRHLGLTMPQERQDIDAAIDRMTDEVMRGVDVTAIRQLAESASDLPTQSPSQRTWELPSPSVRIGLLKDAAFLFYYEENLAALRAAGAELVPISPIGNRELPEIDALYAGGGYPEEHLAALAANTQLRTALSARIAEGMPVWAECGGLMYLGRSITRDGILYPMVGALPIDIEQTSRPQGHGYVEASVDTENPFLSKGTYLRGHEFHYSRMRPGGTNPDTVLRLERGVGVGAGRDGIVVNRVFATYLHLFAPGVPEWTPALLRAARQFQTQRSTSQNTKGVYRGEHCSWRHEHRSGRGWVHSGA